jgi:hypothetical protein
MSIDRYALMAQGIYVNSVTEAGKLQTLATKLWPVRTCLELIRIGAAYDGGYLVPDDLKNISACFSPGVAGYATFEEALLADFGIESHLADYSVDGPPNGFNPKSFKKNTSGLIVTSNTKHSKIGSTAQTRAMEI